MSTANELAILSRLQGVQRNVNGWRALCPAHADKNPSLSIDVRDGRILLHCHAGCSIAAVLQAAGIDKQELFLDEDKTLQIVAEYDYIDERGNLLSQVVRFQPKTFRQRRPDGKGGWLWNLNGVRRVLYRLPEVISAQSVLICEGEKDCEAARRRGLIATCNLGGAGKWRGDYSEALRGKVITIIADADEVGRKHARHVAASLKGKVGLLKLIELPGAKDLHDWFAAGHTEQELLALIETAPPVSGMPQQQRAEEATGTGSYRLEKGRIIWLKSTSAGLIPIPLSNFSARIVEEAILDDGRDTARSFEIEGHLADGPALPRIRIPAEKFSSMSWVSDSWGARAIVSAGQGSKDRLREAVQTVSGEIPWKRIFAHTGWTRAEDERWVFLTSGGAVGAEGFEVELAQDLRRYSLPRNPENVRQAVELSLRLFDLAPLTVTAPLWAGIFRAPLASACPLDVSLFLEGPTGSLKSTLAALLLSHFGNFERTSLPGAWASTANQLEHRAFLLKDVAFVVDDFAPSPLDARELESKAARLLRAQGNLAGRGRLRSDLSEHITHPPRGLIIATGEQHPTGQSILARTLVLQLEPNAVDLSRLADLQTLSGQLPHAMAGYVAWLAPQMNVLPALLAETFSGTRARAFERAGHLRVPEALAHLWLGLHSGLQFAEEIGAIASDRAAELRTCCWSALVELGKEQSRLLEGERPSRRFLESLATLLAQRRAFLLSKGATGSFPATDGFLGWRDENQLLLLPDASFQAVSRFCREAGEPFPVRRDRLFLDLKRERLSDCDPKRTLKAVRICGQWRRILALHRVPCEELIGDTFQPVASVASFSG